MFCGLTWIPLIISGRFENIMETVWRLWIHTILFILKDAEFKDKLSKYAVQLHITTFYFCYHRKYVSLTEKHIDSKLISWCSIFFSSFLNENNLKSKSAVGGGEMILGLTAALDKQMFSISQNDASSDYMLTVKSFDI